MKEASWNFQPMTTIAQSTEFYHPEKFDKFLLIRSFLINNENKVKND